MRARQLPVILAAWCLGFPLLLSAQTAADGTSGPPPFKVDLAVPDAPAFKLITVDPSALLRPQTTRELTVALSGFETASGSVSLPHAFAIEFSPVLLLQSGDVSTVDYDAKKLLYSLRFSAATRRDTTTGAPSQIAIGARLTAYSEAGIRNDPSYPPDLQVGPLNDSILEVVHQARLRQGGTGAVNLSTEDQRRVDSLRAEIRQRWERRYWNADVTDVAFAVRAHTRDSTGANPSIDQYAFWGTIGKGLGTMGQLLLGIRMGYQRDSLSQTSFHQSLDIGSRLYFGTNRYKGFLEVQQSWRESLRPASLFNTGFELVLSSSVWANLSAGVIQMAGAPAKAVTSFKLNTAFPRL